MITELLDSYREHDSLDGWTVERHFSSSWDEWVADEGVYVNGQGVAQDSAWLFPRVGWELENRPWLAVTDRRAKAIDNEEVDVEILYSTKGKEARNQTEDQVGPWEEEFDISLEEVTVKAFLDKSGQF